MVWIENRDLGKVYLSVTLTLFAYYTLWVIVLPFVEPEYKETVSAFFPPLELALIVPAVLGVTLFTLLLGRAYQLVCLDRSEDS